MNSYVEYKSSNYIPFISNIFKLLKMYHDIYYYALLLPEKIKVGKDGNLSIIIVIFFERYIQNYIRYFKKNHIISVCVCLYSDIFCSNARIFSGDDLLVCSSSLLLSHARGIVLLNQPNKML